MACRLQVLALGASIVLVNACSTNKSSVTGPSGGGGGSAANIVKVSGDSQIAPYEAALPKPAIVKVVDARGNAASDVSVAWVVTLFDTSQGLVITTTNASGETQLAPVLGGLPGAFSIRAGINGHDVTFTGSSDLTLASGLKSLQGSLLANCGLTTPGAAYCWGNGIGGQLGNGSSGPHTGPVPVSGGNTFAQISMGAFLVCGLTTSGSVYCWGDPSNGAMGNGAPIGGMLIPTPVPAATGHTFTQVSVGEGTSCGVSSGTAYCWGRGAYGGLGTGDTVSHWAPTAVLAPSGVTFSSVTTGGAAFACALTPAGAAYCWGYNFFGQLGIGSSSPSFSALPVAVTGGHVFTELIASSTGICGLATGGKVYCWGSGLNGTGTAGNEYAPTAVQQGSVSFTEVSANGQHACALAATGAAYCWGDDEDGDSGDGLLPPSTGLPVAVTGGLTFSTVFTGSASSCGLTTAKAMYCWGGNTIQQLGLAVGADTVYTAPVPIPGVGGS